MRDADPTILASTARALPVLAAFLALTCMLAAGPAAAQVTDPAFACQRAAGKAKAKYVKSHTACQAKCIQRARKGEVSHVECRYPYLDIATQDCVGLTFSPKSAGEKAVASMAKACIGPDRECPSCYGACAGYLSQSITFSEAVTGIVLSQVHCGSPDTPVAGKCMDATGKAYAKYVAAVTKCHEKCRVNERKGTTDGSCEAPASDSVTAACVATAETKTALAIDKKCFVPPAAPPACMGWPTSGATWVDFFDESFTAFFTDDSGQTYCVPPVCCQTAGSCSALSRASECPPGGTTFEGDFVCDATNTCVASPGTPGSCCAVADACTMTSPFNCISFPGASPVPAAVCVAGDDNVCFTTPRKLVFVTQQQLVTGDINGVSGGDAKCAAEASGTGLPGTYKAWLSDGTTSAADRLTHATVPYKRVDGVTIADDWADLTDGTLDAPLDRDAFGSPVGDVTVFTGTAADGSTGSLHCTNWTNSNPLPLGVTGRTTATTSSWTQETFSSCGTQRRLYCIEQ